MNTGIENGNKSNATLNLPNSILYDSGSNSLIFTQSHAIRQIKLGKSFLDWGIELKLSNGMIIEITNYQISLL